MCELVWRAPSYWKVLLRNDFVLLSNGFSLPLESIRFVKAQRAANSAVLGRRLRFGPLEIWHSMGNGVL